MNCSYMLISETVIAYSLWWVYNMAVFRISQFFDGILVIWIENAENQKTLAMTNTSMWQYISSCSLIV